MHPQRQENPTAKAKWIVVRLWMFWRESPAMNLPFFLALTLHCYGLLIIEHQDAENSSDMGQRSWIKFIHEEIAKNEWYEEYLIMSTELYN